MLLKIKKILAFVLLIHLSSCSITPPPNHIDSVCQIFKQYPRWYTDALRTQQRWHVPIPVQMAIIHQESKFNAQAKPPRTKLLWFIPWARPSSAYGYSQALDGTWKLYQRQSGYPWSSRENFADGVDFIGWYAHEAHRMAGIPPSNAYALYLAYHEGIGGYQRKTYLKKKWLMPVARKVAFRAQMYQAQLRRCR